ncbi:MAG: hypothetical protein ABFD10_11515 [Prolixibacteraceae bacterium]
MARQTGDIRLTGSLGGISYYYDSRNGYLARKKSKLNRDRVLSDPAFGKTRENASDFGTASRASGLFRSAFNPLLQKIPARLLHLRLIPEFMKVIRSDRGHARGSRKIAGGDLGFLLHFEFNKHTEAKVYVPYTVNISREKGEAEIVFGDFIPHNYIRSVPGSTHFQFISAVAEIDFENSTYHVDTCESRMVIIGPQREEPIHLKLVLAGNDPNPVFVVLGAKFYSGIDGTSDAVRNGISDWYKIVAIDIGKAQVQI